MPVFKSTSAILLMQHRLGSIERKPQVSSRSKPLYIKFNLCHIPKRRHAHLMQSMSIKCCSAILFSLFTFLCNAVKMLFLPNKYSPHSRFISNKVSFAIPCSSVLAPLPAGGIAKYSSSSRSTMMACFARSGFALGANSPGEPDSARCA